MSKSLPSVTSPPWGPTTKRTVAVLALVGLVLLLSRVDKTAWISLVVTLLLGYILSPLVRIFENRLCRIEDYGLRRTLAVLLTWLLLLAILGVVIGLIVPATVQQLRGFAQDLPNLISNAEQDLKAQLDRPIRIGGYELVPWDELQQFFVKQDSQTEEASLTATLQDWLLSLANPAINVLGGAVTFLLTAFLTIVMLFYVMRDGPVFVQYVVSAVPESYQGDVARLLHELGLIWNGYLRGQLLLGTAIAVVTYFTTLILGLPNPLLLALVAGFLEFIPNIGPTLSAVPAVLFAFTADSTTIASLHSGLFFAVIVTLSYFMIQQLEAMFLVPRVMGHSLGLHPLVVLVAILMASTVFGIMGIILAAPTVATLRLIGRYLRGKLLDEDMFPALPAYQPERRGWVYRLIRVLLNRRFPVMPSEQYEGSYTVHAEIGPEGRETSDAWMR